MAGILQEFREFALRGSVVDLAVGIIIGTAFGAVVKGLVDELIMPMVGVLLGGVDFSDRFFILRRGDAAINGTTTLQEARSGGAAVIGYGQFLNLLLTFLIVAWAVFLIVKGVNRMRRKQQKAPDPEAQTRSCPECLTQVPKAARRCSACTAPIAPQPAPPAS
ncbi:MAG: large conductance mechanosensitive channel protein MscL [Candidatus Thermoplasmatota archaeon]